MYQHRGVGVGALQVGNAAGLELLVHDTGAVPHQDVGAGFPAHIITQVTVRGPDDLLALVGQVLRHRQRDARGHHPVRPGLHRGGGVGVHHHLAIGVLVTKRGELVDRAAQVQGTGRLQGRHQHALVRGENLGRLPHEPDPGHNQGGGRMIVTEAGHFQGIGYAATGLLRQRLDDG